MPAERNRPHIITPWAPAVEAYRPHVPPMRLPKPPIPPEGRHARGTRLLQELQAASQAAESQRRALGVGVTHGIYLQFESLPDWELQSLEFLRSGIELTSVVEEQTPHGSVFRATVYVPEGKLGHFVTRLTGYAGTPQAADESRSNKNMVDRVQSIRLASLRALWTDAPGAYPREGESVWWEVWLRKGANGAEVQGLRAAALQLGMDVGSESLAFFDRTVVNVRATSGQLASSMHLLEFLAELRLAKLTAASFTDMPPGEQIQWVEELLGRTEPARLDAPVVCVLDTGVNNGHRLLAHSLARQDLHSHVREWGAHDHHGHGTEMAGLALYGDLTPVLGGTERVVLRHRLESVKILPPEGQTPNDPKLYGFITAACVDRVASAAPARTRVHSLSVMSTDERDLGQPTSWSAAIDALAAGRSFDATARHLTYLGERVERRLVVLSAGNVARASMGAAHLDVSDATPVHDPGQAWNAITVGAHTEKATFNDPTFRSHQVMARPGELSPWSTTSVGFQNTWPIKPDVVFEGGNLVHDGKHAPDAVADLCVLTTHHAPAVRSFAACDGTSAAAAQVARMAAMIHAEYPALWPEAVRALVVHSARWNPQMLERLRGARTKQARSKLVRRYGFGVPSVERALRSASDSLALVAQGTIKPFRVKKLREIHFHKLPWPRDVLLGLGEKPVHLRVTLSYFVEPNPARRGWRKRHSYASHGLRFEVKSCTQSEDDFRKRLNQLALAEEEERPGQSDDRGAWFLGTGKQHGRDKGSLHSDFIFNATGADLAERGVVGVYPVSGWWKEQPAHDRSEHGVRYALVVSLETEEQGVDLWTPVATVVGLPMPVPVTA